MEGKPAIFIAVTAYRGWVRNECANSLLNLVSACANAGMTCAWNVIDQEDIATVRGFFGSLMLERNAHSHLLFWDNDIEAEPDVVLKLLRAKKPVIGAVYAKRLTPIVACVPEDWKPSAAIDPIPWIAMGLTLIETNVFRLLAATGRIRQHPVHQFERYGLTAPLFRFFDRIQDRADGGYKSEDVSFCMRWRELCNGEVWALSGEKIRHWGEFAYELPHV